jgi:hypothetical protein
MVILIKNIQYTEIYSQQLLAFNTVYTSHIYSFILRLILTNPKKYMLLAQ